MCEAGLDEGPSNPSLKSLGEEGRQSCFQDAELGLRDRVADPVKNDLPLGFIQNQKGRAGIFVSRLAHGSRIDQVAFAVPQGNPGPTWDRQQTAHGLPGLAKDTRQVSVAEEAEEEIQPPEEKGRRIRIHQVLIFVQRRTVGHETGFTQRPRPRRKIRQVISALGRQKPAVHQGGLERKQVEILSLLDSCDDAIVVSSDDDSRVERLDHLHYFVRTPAVTHQVSEYRHAVVPQLTGRLQAALGSFQVGMQIAQDESSHDRWGSFTLG